jgi:hypothetical protein
LSTRPDPTTYKGDAGNDIGPRVNVSRQTVRGLFKISHLYYPQKNFPPILTIMPMEFQFHHRAIEGHVSNFHKHSYARSSSGDIFCSSLERSTMPALSPLLPCSFSFPSRCRHSPRSPSPLSPRLPSPLSPHLPSLLSPPPQPYSSLAPPLPI